MKPHKVPHLVCLGGVWGRSVERSLLALHPLLEGDTHHRERGTGGKGRGGEEGGREGTEGEGGKGKRRDGREESTSQDVTLCIQLHSACTGNGIDTREWKWKVDWRSSKASFHLQSTHSIAYMCTQSHALYTRVRSAAMDILIIRIPVLESSIRTRPDMFYRHSRYHAT